MNTLTHSPVAHPVATRTSSPLSRVLGAVGVTIPVISYLGVHEFHPEGAIERMTDTEIAAWASSGAEQIWAGGVLELLTALMLVLFGAGLADRMHRWGASTRTQRVGLGSIQIVAALVAMTGLLQVMAGVLATPEEAYQSPTLLVVCVLLYGNLNVAAWCLLAPAAAAISLTSGAPRWLRVISGMLALLLLGTLVMPFVSWGPGFLWLFATGLALVFGRGDRDD